jgi:predicted porin
LAALAAAGVASAQSSVTAFGVVDIGYTAGGQAGNRIGFRGTEDLGGGLRAGFIIEQGIEPTNAAMFGARTATSGIAYDGQAVSTNQFDVGTAGAYSQGTNRQSYVSLAGGFGEIRAGYQYTTLYEISTLSGFSQGSEGVIGAGISHTWGNGAAGGTRANGITYISPRMSGFEVSAQFGSAGGRASTEWGAANSANGLTKDKQERMSFKLDYNQGPLRAAIGYTKFESDQSARANNCVTSGTAAGTSMTNNAVCIFNVYGALTSYNGATTNAATTFETDITQLAVSYDFGVAKVGATHNRGSKNVTSAGVPSIGAQTLSAATTSAVGNYDFSSSAVSIGVPVGAARLVAGYGTAKLESATATQADYTQWQIGATYALSKRTTAYFYNGKWTNKSATTATAFRKASQSIVGLAHSF